MDVPDSNLTAIPPVKASWFNPFRFPLLVALLVFIFDQLTKILVIRKLLQGEVYPVCPSFFHLVHYRNTGAAWGMFQGKTLLLGLFSIVILGGIFWRFKHLTDGRVERAWALGLVIGGTLGNLYDRLFRGEVVDFLLFFHRSFKWPAFNLADSAICCGVAVFIVSSFLFPGAGADHPDNKQQE